MEKMDEQTAAADNAIIIMESLRTDASMVIDAIKAGDKRLALDLLRMMQGGRAVECAIDWACCIK